MCSNNPFPVIDRICFTIKCFSYVLFCSLILSFLGFFPFNKSMPRFLLMMPTCHFFLPRHAKTKSAAHLSALLWYKQDEIKAQHQKSSWNLTLWPLKVVHLSVILNGIFGFHQCYICHQCLLNGYILVSDHFCLSAKLAAPSREDCTCMCGGFSSF